MNLSSLLLKGSQIILLVLLFSSFGIESLHAEPSAPEYLRTKDWKIKKLNGTNIVLTANVVFYNPNKVKAKLNELDLDIFLNEKIIGKLTESNSVKIKGKSSFEIPISLKFDLKDSGLNLSNLVSLITNQKLLVDLKGFIKANVFLIPFKVKINERQEFSAKDFF